MITDAELPVLAPAVLDIARRAGAAIMEVYRRGFDVETKADGSPLTQADRRAHELITAGLAELTPALPVLSEESRTVPYSERRDWRQFWLVDPLDGTKEFVKRNGEFTVNIALIEADEAILGVVHTPARGLSHWGWRGGGAHRQQLDGPAESIGVRRDSRRPVIVASRSHGRDVLDRFLTRVERQRGGYELTSLGSALKICLIAEGGGDIYPRFGLTCEWDTAAAHCVLSAAGGRLTNLHGTTLRYNKEDILNPWFIAVGASDFDWYTLVADLAPPDQAAAISRED